MTVAIASPPAVPAPDPKWVDDVVVRRAVHLALHGPGSAPAPGRPLTSGEISEAERLMYRLGCPEIAFLRARVAWRLEQRRYCSRCGTDFTLVAVQRHRVESGLFECNPCPGGAR